MNKPDGLTPYESKSWDCFAQAFPWRKAAAERWTRLHRHHLERVFLTLDSLLPEADAERVKALLREEL